MPTGDYRAVICITTCSRLSYLRRYLPHFADFAVGDGRFDLLVAIDGPDGDTVRFCREWEIPALHATKREGVGLSKNRVLERFPDYDYYFFLDDDVELVDGRVFPEHVVLARVSGIHHFSLFAQGGVRKRTGESMIERHRVVHGLFGGGQFNFYTGVGLKSVGGWHPRFAEYRRWGHTEHSYRIFRSGLAPAPFNVAEDLSRCCIWHYPRAVSPVQAVATDEDQLPALERKLIDEELRYVPVQTLSPYQVEGLPGTRPQGLAATLTGGQRYPLVDRHERRRCWSDYQLWQYQHRKTRFGRASALIAAGCMWPANPALRHTVKHLVNR